MLTSILKSAAVYLLVVQTLAVQNPGKIVGFPKIEFSEELKNKFDTIAQSCFDQDLFNGTILIAHNGTILYEKGFGCANFQWDIPNTGKTVFNLASVSKPFTAVAILMLMERGKIRLDDPVSSYSIELKNEIFKRITIRQLLSHTSGLPDEPLPPALISNLSFKNRKDLIAALNQLDPIFEPGTSWSYSNSGYNVLAVLVESLSGRPFGDFMRDEIFRPLGMSDSFFKSREDVIKNCAEGYGILRGKIFVERSVHMDIQGMGPGNIYSTAEDLFKWDQALEDHKLLSARTTELMFTPLLNHYGFGWNVPPDFYINSRPQVLVEHSGRGPGSSTILRRFLKERLLIVVLSNVQNSKVQYLADHLCLAAAGGKAFRPRPSFERDLQVELFSKGVDPAKNAYLAAKKEGRYQMPGASGLNRLAYQFLRSGRVEEALKVFELYLALYPGDSFAHDGYAEALYINNEIGRSAEYYQKALELNPKNAAALRMLKHLNRNHSAGEKIPLQTQVD